LFGKFPKHNYSGTWLEKFNIKNFKLKQLAFFVLFLLNGCGINIIEKNNCVPKLKFVSTQNVNFHLIKLLDPNFSYSDLKLKNDEGFLCISTPNFISCDDSFGKLKVTKLPVGTELQLTGDAKKIEPYGLSTAFKNDMIYLKGKIKNKTIWVPFFELHLFAEYGNESKLNTESCRTLGITDSTIVGNVNCFN